MRKARKGKVLVLFGTRPELIKLAPVVHELRRKSFQTVVVSSSQHKQLLSPFLGLLSGPVDHDLRVMRENQCPNEVFSRVLKKLDRVLEAERPHMVIVQGDTSTTLAGAMASFNRRIAVGHVEAGLRSGNALSPFPEEMNRRLVSQVADLHFAATEANAANLRLERIEDAKIFVTGNPVVDSLKTILGSLVPSRRVRALIAKTEGQKRLLLTTHRRESFGREMAANLAVLRDFVERNKDVCLMFPVHPNPNVRGAAEKVFAGKERVHLLKPLNYYDFVALMGAAWLIVSDSGGVQEEAPSLGKPLLILRKNTERPEAIESGIAKLVGDSPGSLKQMLTESYLDRRWTHSVSHTSNPFGDGNAAERIVAAIAESLREH